jgi:hypothetical protein
VKANTVARPGPLHPTRHATAAKAPRRPKEPAPAPEGLPARRRGAAPARRRETAPARGAAAVAGVAPPMRFTVDVSELAVVLELDTEPPGVDLTQDSLGDDFVYFNADAGQFAKPQLQSALNPSDVERRAGDSLRGPGMRAISRTIWKII